MRSLYEPAGTLQSLQRVRERRGASCHFSCREGAVAPVARNLITGNAGPRLVQGVAQRARDSFPNKDDGLPRLQRLDELEAARGGFSRGGRDGRADPERRRGHGVPQRCGARRRRSHLFQLSSLNTREVRERRDIAPRRHRHLFEEAYFNRFRVQLANTHANLVNVNTSVIGQRAEMNLSTLIDPEGRKDTVADAETGRRTVVFNDGPHETPVYWRDYLPINMEIDGPAIIEQMDCTTLVEPGDKARGDADGNIIIGVGGL